MIEDAVNSEQSKILLSTLSWLLGWTYFLCWGFSCYPQSIINYRRKSVTGLSIDYFTINILGHSCYTISCMAFLYSDVVREQYKVRFPESGDPTVRVNDLAFTAHALFWSLLTYTQFYFWGYKRLSTQRLSKATFYFIVASVFVVLGACGLVISAPQGQVPKLPLPKGEEAVVARWEWIDVAYILGTIKLLGSLLKYWPQAALNYHNKSTSGWSILKCLLDFAGAILSLFQLFIDAYLAAGGKGWDFSAVIGNPLKFWLGFVSIWFDIVFMLQHYVFYPVGKRREAVEEEEGQRRSKKGDELEQEGDEEVSRAMLHDHESGRALATRYDTIPSSSA